MIVSKSLPLRYSMLEILNLLRAFSTLIDEAFSYVPGPGIPLSLSKLDFLEIPIEKAGALDLSVIIKILNRKSYFQIDSQQTIIPSFLKKGIKVLFHQFILSAPFSRLGLVLFQEFLLGALNLDYQTTLAQKSSRNHLRISFARFFEIGLQDFFRRCLLLQRDRYRLRSMLLLMFLQVLE